MQVVKRDGTRVSVCLSEVQEKITELSVRLDVDPCAIATRVCESLVDGIHTHEIDEISAEVAMGFYSTHPDYEDLAVRLLVDNMSRVCPPGFAECTRILHASGMVSDEYMDVVAHMGPTTLDELVLWEHEYNLSYFGLKTLIGNKYLMRQTNGVLCERPSYMWLRVAIGIHLHLLRDIVDTGVNVVETAVFGDVVECVNNLAGRSYTHATPTLFNAGTPRPQFASCFLLALNSDSIQGIYGSLTECALVSKHAGGIGLHLHDLRAKGSIIRSTGCHAEGLIPVLRVFNESVMLVKQAGKRPGSIAAYMSPDHADIERFLDMRLNRGEERERCRDIFSALWIPDLFMQRVVDNGPWHLFSPDEAPGLSDVYGAEYEALYARYVEEGRFRKAIRARAVWVRLITSQIETGTPYMTYKDSANRHSNQSNVGVIKSSNLCTEIMEVSTPDRVAVCNLSSICLSRFVDDDGVFDYARLERVTRLIVRALNAMIDGSFYPLDKARASNAEMRPLGIGVQGWQTLLFKLKLPFDSEEARALNRRIFATIYYHAWDESASLARKDGPYERFHGSPLQKGVLHCDSWVSVHGGDLVDGFDWAALRLRVALG
eukprot:6214183-Pleurochrysis_carterae.AAC.1